MYGKVFLVLTDAHSKWLEVWPMNSTTTSAVLEKLRDCFSRFGLPNKIISDNGPQFESQLFKEFITQNGIVHITSAPYNPSTNGAAENSVNIVKKFLMKEKDVNDLNDLHRSLCRFLLYYRSTPHCSTGVAPATLMFNRNVKTRFNLLQPDNKISNFTSEKIQHTVNVSQNRQIKNYKGKINEFYLVGQEVYVKDYRKNKPCWTMGVILKILGPRNYLVNIVGTNMIWKRHCNQLRKRYVYLCNNNDNANNVNNEVSREVNPTDDEDVFLDAETGSVQGDDQPKISERRVQPPRQCRTRSKIQGEVV